MNITLKALIVNRIKSDLVKLNILESNKEGEYRRKGSSRNYHAYDRDDVIIDLSSLTKKETENLLQLLDQCGVHGCKVAAADVRKYLKAAKEGVEGLRARTVRQAAWMLEHFFARLPHHTIFSKDDYGAKSHSGYYVADVDYIPKRNEGRYDKVPEHCEIDIWHIEDDDRRKSVITLYRGDCLEKTCLEILANEGFVPETEKLMEKLRTETERFYQEIEQIGKQCVAVGVGLCDLDNALLGGNEDKRSYSWGKRKLRLDHFGESRVVIDVLTEKDTENRRSSSGNSGGVDPYRWHKWNMRFHTPSEDEVVRHLEADENTVEPCDVDIPVHPLVPCFDLRRHVRLRVHVNNLTKYVYDEKVAERLVLPERDWQMIELLVDHSTNTFQDIVANKGRSMNILSVGPPGCLHGNTPIYDPVDDSTKTVEERYLQGLPFHVWSLNHETGKPEITKAEAPWKYLPANMVKVEFDNGQEIIVTEGHLFWHGDSYAPAHHLVSALQGCSSIPVPSILESDLLILRQDAYHLKKTTQDFQDDYQISFCFYDEPLRMVLNNDLVFSPLQVDVQEPFRANLHKGDLDKEHTDNVFDPLLSNKDCFPLIGLPLEVKSFHQHKQAPFSQSMCLYLERLPFVSNYEAYGRFVPIDQVPHLSISMGSSLVLSLIEKSFPSIYDTLDDDEESNPQPHHHIYLKSLFESYQTKPIQKEQHLTVKFDGSAQKSPFCMGTTNILRVGNAGVNPYYDFHVPGFENYWACGCFHHNTGKTATAEVFSEFKKRPLYTIQCSQLGMDAETVENNLGVIMMRANRWNAVLLLDEADVYIRKRSTDLNQNAIVGAFLRVLEYASCILFMTSNLGDEVDDAITSRCIARLNYESPKPEHQFKIWRILADINNLKLDDKEINKIVERHPKLTGRDVKNLLKLASFVSQSNGKPLDAKAIEYAMIFKPTETVK